jgi:hypothetical protein
MARHIWGAATVHERRGFGTAQPRASGRLLRRQLELDAADDDGEAPGVQGAAEAEQGAEDEDAWVVAKRWPQLPATPRYVLDRLGTPLGGTLRSHHAHIHRELLDGATVGSAAAAVALRAVAEAVVHTTTAAPGSLRVRTLLTCEDPVENALLNF